ncbi:protein ecdysoneless [Uranotaenia lowii]|uniref:protein ecdysoneless n=1 Tax=Uranotaenia lowii TaxID=190385 RepID=UPI0024791DDD|nr:protein ecdysoneless [Uranotaenia lowii]
MTSSAGVLQSVREDDFVEYFLFPAGAGLTASDLSLANYLSETALESIRAEVTAVATEYCRQYLWHRDGFAVHCRRGGEERRILIEANGDKDAHPNLPPHLHGISHIGENIQDEWFIVSLLFHLTRQIPGLVARVADSDGEFLLIEAAEHLPRWANPETCEGRVFIYDGQLVLVGNGEEPDKSAIELNTVLAELRKGSGQAKWTVSDAIRACIHDRIKDFPEKIVENHHRETLYVPVGVAAALKENPQLISAAVLAFCNRDPVDLKACRAMRFFPPENCVYTSAVFTKCLYAMLTHSNYLPDRRTGWNLPKANDPNYKAHMLGVKLACGFEILASQAKSSQSLETDKAWLSYYESLKAKGYFQQNIEGSQEYNRLLGTAKSYYTENRDSMKFTPKIGEEIVALLKRNDFDVEELRKQGQNLPQPDDDSWLNISPEELDDMLTKRYGVKKLFALNGNADQENFSSMVSEFLEQKSEFDGVEQTAVTNQFDLASVRPTKPKRTKSKAKADATHKQPVINHQPSPLHQPIDFDPDAFTATVKNLLDLVIPEDRWDSSTNSDMSDYGEEDYDQNIEDMSPTRTGKAVRNQLQTYMDQMDRELAKTTIGKSFETDIGEDLPSMANNKAESDDFDDIESFKPVDIDVNTLKNMMESYQSQIGGPGPAANLLGSMGIHVSRAPGSSKAKPGSTRQTDV